MHILFLNRSYYPDVEATGQLLSELCADLARRHEVTVIAGQPNFVPSPAGAGLVRRESHQGVRILRVRNLRFRKVCLLGRIAGLASYLLLAAWTALVHRRPDVIVVETDPPILGALGAFLKWWHGCPLVFYLQDLFPEVGLALGRLSPGPMTSFLRRMTQVGLDHANRVVVLGDDMRRRVLARGIRPDKIDVVPNWVDTAAVRPVDCSAALRRSWGLNGEFVVMYSGNLGLSQDLRGVLEAARRLRGESIAFAFVGEGGAKAGLVETAKAWGLDNVTFLPYQPKERLSESLGAADLHLIPLRRGLAGCVVPSKLYGILAAGRPYLAAVDGDSEVAQVTRQHATGVLTEPDDTEGLIASIRWCAANREELTAMGRRGRRLAEERFDRRQSVWRFDRVLAQTPRRFYNPRLAAPAGNGPPEPSTEEGVAAPETLTNPDPSGRS